MPKSKEERLAAAKKAWDEAFNKPIMYTHKPTQDEILDVYILAVYDAGIKEGESNV
jgi:hypothetical protein